METPRNKDLAHAAYPLLPAGQPGSAESAPWRRRHPTHPYCAGVLLMAVSLSALPALAQSAPEENEEDKAEAVVAASPGPTLGTVEVTGSAIRRADAETAVPVTILKAESLKAQGITSVDELMHRLSVNNANSGQEMVASGSYSGGASFANLRGIGSDKTLVLLNGRRIANNAFEGSAADLNMISFEALENVQILRDGASALYGSDAIGGVINFITKKNYRGGTIQLDGSTPSAKGGGQEKGISGSFGFGDLDQDRFNIMGVLSYQQDNGLPRRSRHFVDRDNNPHVHYTGWNYNAPANYYQGNNIGTPVADDRACRAAGHWPTGDGGCGRDAWDDGYWASPKKQFSAYTEALFKLSDNHTAGVNFFWTRNRIFAGSNPDPVRDIEVSPDNAFYPGNGITPLPGNWQLDTSQPVQAQYLTSAMGPRKQRNTNDGKRLMFTLNGKIAGSWSYDTALTYNASRLTDKYTSGWMDSARVRQLVRDEVLNPFAETPSTAAQRALRNAELRGSAISARGDVYAWDGKVTGELGDWFGAGPAALALGGDARHERFDSLQHQLVTRNEGSGLSPDGSISARRDVQGAYSELNVPLLDSLEVSASMRYDRYSQVGDDSNPKLSFRFQPVHSLVVRGSYSEGFRAPTLYELYDPQARTFASTTVDDPLLCPNGKVDTGAGGLQSRDCDAQFRALLGGNGALKPEQARNWTLGFVIEPIKSLTATLDFWWIEIDDQIGVRNLRDIVKTTPQAIHRKADGSIDYIDNLNENIAKTDTNGVDLALNYSWDTRYGLWSADFQGTYTGTYKEDRDDGKGWVSSVGKDNDTGVILPRWKHDFSINWSKGAWNAGITNNFQTSYRDWKPTDPEVVPNSTVGSFITWDTLVGYQIPKGPKVTLGAKNLFDKKPPFTDASSRGIDPLYYDPIGRTLYAHLSYSF